MMMTVHMPMSVRSVPMPVFLALSLPVLLERVVHGLPSFLPHPHLLVRQEAPLQPRLNLIGVHLGADDDELLKRRKCDD